MKPINIALVASQGGHAGQMGIIFKPEVIGSNNAIFITESPDDLKTKEKHFQKKYRTYFFKKDYLCLNEHTVIPSNPVRYLSTMLKLMRIYKKEKIDVLVTNGAQISIPAVIGAKLMGIKTIFIESFIRVKNPTLTGRACYPFADIFLVQHESIKPRYGKKARVEGSVL